MARLVAIAAVPGLPGATTSSLVAGAEARQRAKACSRAPAPRSKIFTSQPYRDVPLRALSAVLHVSCSTLTEIGRVPRRDRSISGSRSVVLRTEIGSVAGRNQPANMILDGIRSLPPMLESTLNTYHSLQRAAHMPRICRIEQSNYLPPFRNRSSMPAKGDPKILLKPHSQILTHDILRQNTSPSIGGNFYFCTKIPPLRKASPPPSPRS